MSRHERHCNLFSTHKVAILVWLCLLENLEVQVFHFVPIFSRSKWDKNHVVALQYMQITSIRYTSAQFTWSNNFEKIFALKGHFQRNTKMHNFTSRFPVNNDNCRFDQPIKSFFKLHGRFGIGSIENLGAMLTTVGRDGVLQKFEIDRTFAENFAQTEWIRKAGSTRLKFTWLEKLLQFSGKSFVLGFHSDKFVVFNLTDQVRRFLFLA